MVIKDQSIPLSVTHSLAESPEYMSLFFKRPLGFTFDAGDWMDLQFADAPDRTGTYSFASSPFEDELRITFKRGISEFKRRLQTSEPGDELLIRQYGNDYEFRLQDHRPSTLIAGGIGIAPFRSMILELYETKSRNDVQLIYLSTSEAPLFKDELDMWAHALPHMRLAYINTKTINRKRRQSLIASLLPDTSRKFYVAGPESMVEATEHQLLDLGVSVRSIRIDSFGGY